MFRGCSAWICLYIYVVVFASHHKQQTEETHTHPHRIYEQRDREDWNLPTERGLQRHPYLSCLDIRYENRKSSTADSILWTSSSLTYAHSSAVSGGFCHLSTIEHIQLESTDRRNVNSPGECKLCNYIVGESLTADLPCERVISSRKVLLLKNTFTVLHTINHLGERLGEKPFFSFSPWLLQVDRRRCREPVLNTANKQTNKKCVRKKQQHTGTQPQQ